MIISSRELSVSLTREFLTYANKELYPKFADLKKGEEWEPVKTLTDFRRLYRLQKFSFGLDIKGDLDFVRTSIVPVENKKEIYIEIIKFFNVRSCFKNLPKIDFVLPCKKIINDRTIVFVQIGNKEYLVLLLHYDTLSEFQKIANASFHNIGWRMIIEIHESIFYEQRDINPKIDEIKKFLSGRSKSKIDPQILEGIYDCIVSVDADFLAKSKELSFISGREIFLRKKIGTKIK